MSKIILKMREEMNAHNLSVLIATDINVQKRIMIIKNHSLLNNSDYVLINPKVTQLHQPELTLSSYNMKVQVEFYNQLGARQVIEVDGEFAETIAYDVKSLSTNSTDFITDIGILLQASLTLLDSKALGMAINK
jgi:peptide deformylase